MAKNKSKSGKRHKSKSPKFHSKKCETPPSSPEAHCIDCSCLMNLVDCSDDEYEPASPVSECNTMDVFGGFAMDDIPEIVDLHDLPSEDKAEIDEMDARSQLPVNLDEFKKMFAFTEAVATDGKISVDYTIRPDVLLSLKDSYPDLEMPKCPLSESGRKTVAFTRISKEHGLPYVAYEELDPGFDAQYASEYAALKVKLNNTPKLDVNSKITIIAEMSESVLHECERSVELADQLVEKSRAPIQDSSDDEHPLGKHYDEVYPQLVEALQLAKISQAATFYRKKMRDHIATLIDESDDDHNCCEHLEMDPNEISCCEHMEFVPMECCEHMKMAEQSCCGMGSHDIRKVVYSCATAVAVCGAHNPKKQVKPNPVNGGN